MLKEELWKGASIVGEQAHAFHKGLFLLLFEISFGDIVEDVLEGDGLLLRKLVHAGGPEAIEQEVKDGKF